MSKIIKLILQIMGYVTLPIILYMFCLLIYGVLISISANNSNTKWVEAILLTSFFGFLLIIEIYGLIKLENNYIKSI